MEYDNLITLSYLLHELFHELPVLDVELERGTHINGSVMLLVSNRVDICS